MSVFIFEDDYFQAQQLRETIEEICFTNHYPFRFVETTSRENELIDKIKESTLIPIYFLDLEIKGEEKKGLEVAREIRKYDSEGIIVFVTTHSELAPISYQYMVSALTFIDKNLPFEEKKKIIETCLEHYAQKNSKSLEEDYFLMETSFTSMKLPFRTIEYIMTEEPHRLQMVTTNQFIQFYGTLKEVEEKDSRLVRCHKSYIVNLMQVEELDYSNQQFILKSGKVVPISRRLMKKMKDLLKGN